MCLVVLLFALVSISGVTMSAQSSTAPAEGQKASPPANTPGATSVAAPKPADPAKQFYKALQTVKSRGGRAHIPDYITTGLGMPNASVNQEPLWASVVADNEGLRTLYLLDDRDVAVLVSQVDGRVMFYVVSGGVFKKAALLKEGRFASKSLQNIPLSSAAASFNVERDFWMQQLAAK
jgi:hypothetical protein